MQPGTQLGRYRLLRKLGAGGMADVYEAEDATLKRRVALKVLPPEMSRTPEFTQRFETEVLAAASLNHHGIVTVYEVGHQDSHHFYAMRLLTGGDLRDRIAQGLTSTQALSILRQVAGAFAHAHAKGFVHRDVKPENILFDEQGIPVLTDFGIVKALESDVSLTKTGHGIGTPRYVSPEQASGKAVDARADLYSLGVILHEMLTGEPPYDGNDAMTLIYQHMSAPIPRLPKPLSHLQPLLDRLMAKDLPDRVPSAEELIKQVEALEKGPPGDETQTLAPPALATAPTSQTVIDAERKAQPLAQWLDALGAASGSRVLLGGTGHLDLTMEEEHHAEREFDRLVLPILARAPADSEVLILTGLAPGADLLFAERAAAGLAYHGKPFRHVGLLPVPLETLWSDWLARVRGFSPAHVARVREQFERAVAGCDALVRLWDPDREPDWQELAARQEQYRRLGVVLAEQCDVMVAIVRPRHAGQPGGASEVVAWRQHSAEVPAAMSTGARRHRSGWVGGDRLLLVDPSDSGGAGHETDPWTPLARRALRGGNYLQCYDVIAQAEEQGPIPDSLRYLKLLALANADSTETALRLLGETRADLRESSEDWLALEGRLHKDLAQRGTSSAPDHFRRSSECYLAAFRKTGGYFSAINAATTSMLAGEVALARSLASGVVSQVGRLQPKDETEHYYLKATEAEAALVLGDPARARQALADADRLLRDDINARSRTRKQLGLICRALKLDAGVLDALQLPPVVYLPPSSKVVQAEVASAFTFTGITEPRELEAAEALARQSQRLHLVIAAPREKMLGHWQKQYGTDWTLRLGRLLANAHEISVALGFLDQEQQWCDSYVATMALGLSRLTARRLGCTWRTIGEDEPGASQPVQAAPIEVRRDGAASVRLDRRFVGLIFADFAGFSRLTDEDLPSFLGHFMHGLGESLSARRDDILLQHTWGDALHVVTRSARAAAEIASEFQTRLERLRPQLSGALSQLELRLSAHYAPVFSGLDPVENMETYFGTQLSFTARIEPVTPPGMIFVTEPFAAQIALEAPDQFALQYAGDVKLAKAYGQSRLFSLRRTGA